jgi:Fe-S-cluster containining protein
MRPPPGARDTSDAKRIYFDAIGKCCTYVPNLPNFLVGRILADGDPEAEAGRASVAERIADGVGVTPLGLAPAPVHSLLYRNSGEAFGRNKALRCPHYIEDGGRCGIWRHRESTCATWFCKHERGALGFEFWRGALHRLLRAVEDDLARWCVLELDVGDETLRRLTQSSAWTSEAETITAEDLDNRTNFEAQARLWGAWRGREQAFYVRCAELVDPLPWAEVLAICGPETKAHARLTVQAFAKLTDEKVPKTLNAGSYQFVQRLPGMARISTYSELDPLDVPDAVMALLPYFDGRSTAAALEAIAAERGVRLDPSLLRKLTDFGLLVAPDRAD